MAATFEYYELCVRQAVDAIASAEEARASTRRLDDELNALNLVVAVVDGDDKIQRQDDGGDDDDDDDDDADEHLLGSYYDCCIRGS